MVSPFQIEEIYPDATAGSVRLPRRQSGSSPQGLTVTLIADYTLGTGTWLPATALVTLLGEFGITHAAARMAISRLARRGVLDSRRHGRYSSYQLSRQAADELVVGGCGIADFAAEPDTWDELWTFVTFSMPQERTTQRNALRVFLRWRGYAPLYDGVWVSPRPMSPADRAELATAASGGFTVVRGRHVALDTEVDRSPVEAWDIAAIAGEYDAFTARWGALLPDIVAGDITGTEAVRARTGVMDTYRRFPSIDPLLPAKLMPAGWARGRAREVFIAVYDGLARSAEEHVRAVAAAAAGHPQPDIAAHTVADMRACLGRPLTGDAVAPGTPVPAG